MEWVENDPYSISRGECLYKNRNLFFLVQAFVNYINQLFNLLFDSKILLCSQYFLLPCKCSLQTMIRPKHIEGKLLVLSNFLSYLRLPMTLHFLKRMDNEENKRVAEGLNY